MVNLIGGEEEERKKVQFFLPNFFSFSAVLVDRNSREADWQREGRTKFFDCIRDMSNLETATLAALPTKDERVKS